MLSHLAGIDTHDEWAIPAQAVSAERSPLSPTAKASPRDRAGSGYGPSRTAVRAARGQGLARAIHLDKVERVSVRLRIPHLRSPSESTGFV